MDLKRPVSRHFRRRKQGDTARLANRLAPLEELDHNAAAKRPASGSQTGTSQADPHYGAIVVDNQDLHVPKDIMEGGEKKTFLGIEPVVIVILVVMLTFIALIAWQISQMPAN
jgi:hypothetical protein